jgi:hypothetical protein
MGVQGIIDLESIDFDTLEIKITGSPPFQKGSRKKTDSGASIKQTAVVPSSPNKQACHKSSNSSRCKKLAELGLPFRIGGF